MKRLFTLFLVLAILFSATACTAGDSGTAAAQPSNVPGESGEPPQGTPPGGMPGEGSEPPQGTPPGGMPGEGGEPPQGTPPGGMPGEGGEPPQGTPPGGMPGEGGEPPQGTPPGGMPGEGGEPPQGTPPGGMPGEGGVSLIEYAAAVEILEAAEQTGKTYTSAVPDESALMIRTSDPVSLIDPAVTKTGDSDGGDNCNFYGLNAAVLVMDGSTVTITGGSVFSSADGANGVFSYGGNGGRNGAAGDGTTVLISGTRITTTGDGSGGIMTTGGGITRATDLTVTTSGRSSAAIRTDRGGGTVEVNGGSYTTNGLGSPTIYSTADITVRNAELTSNLSEGVCIEGKNSVTLENCNLTASNTQCNGNATFHDSVMIYQSMSGDAASGTSAFTMTGGSLTSRNGHMFHVTNTYAVITLSGVLLSNEGSDVLLSVCDDGWNGSSNTAELIADAQALTGRILVGDNSSLTLTLSNSSTFEGTFSGVIENAMGKRISSDLGTVHVTIDAESTWTMTADTYITSFSGSAGQIISNGYTLYVNGIPLEGTN